MSDWILKRNFCLSLRMLRRSRGIKQEALALDLGVSQTTISRWESAQCLPGEYRYEKLKQRFASPSAIPDDSTLKHLVTTSKQPVHLICDHSHRLLAASSTRVIQWGYPLSELLGCCLFKFTTPQIVSAEESLPDLGWYDQAYSLHRFNCGTTAPQCLITIKPALCTWERLYLSDGSTVRLVSG